MNLSYEPGGMIAEMDSLVFSYQVIDPTRDIIKEVPSNTLHWNNVNNYMGDYIVYPYGFNNDLPKIIQQAVSNSYNVPGFLQRKTELLWGIGPKLYTTKLVDGKDIRERVEDNTIQEWLDSWNYEDYLLQCVVDFQHIQGVFTRFEKTKGSRIGKPFFKELHHCSPDKSRLARLKNSSSNKPTHALIGTWQFDHINAIAETKAYPLTDVKKPELFENSVMYSNMYTFCTDYYTIPSLYGSLEWINRSTAVPLIFKAFTKNAASPKYHITSPASFWDKKRNEIKLECATNGITYEEKMLKDYERKFLLKLSEVLTDIQNSGKYIHTVTSINTYGHNVIEEGWEIKVLDQKIKDFIEANILVADKADKAISAGVNIHPVLANITDSGRANSGSEQIYALLNYINTGINIQEMIVTKAINFAIKVNFPESNVKLGFFHSVPEVQANVSPENRTKNENTI